MCDCPAYHWDRNIMSASTSQPYRADRETDCGWKDAVFVCGLGRFCGAAGATGLTQQVLAVAGRDSKDSCPEVSCPPGFET